MMCKHYNTVNGCSYGEKCQFAHGPNELRGYTGPKMTGMMPGSFARNPNQKNPLNYKIVKCKNYEKDGSCKYGNHCTYAHGDDDLRSKNENMLQIQPVQMMIPMYGMDMNQMNQMMPGMDMAQMQQMMGVNPMANMPNMPNIPNMMSPEQAQMLMGMNQNQDIAGQGNAQVGQPIPEAKN